MPFSLTPVSGFPPQTPDEFPNFIQFQEDGLNLGLPDADTLNVTGNASLTRGTGENSNVVTLNVASTSTGGAGGGGSDTPTLVLALAGTADGAFDGSDFSNWTGTVVQTSADATWAEYTNLINIETEGIYEVSIAARVVADGGSSWPSTGNGWSQFGSNVTEAIALPKSRYSRQAAGSFGDNSEAAMQWHDQFVVDATDLPQTVVPRLYAQAYSGGGVTATFSAVVTVKRISPSA